MTTQILGKAVPAHPTQEGADRVAWLRLDHADVLLLADGAGNSSKGARAAEAFVSIASSAARSARQPESTNYWEMVLRSIDSSVMRSCDGGLTTGVVVVCGAAEVWAASVGDSAAWLVGGAQLTPLLEAGPSRDLLGSGRCQPRTYRSPHRGGRVVLTSDGVHKYVERELLAIALGLDTLEESAQAALTATLDSVGNRLDDAAVVLWEQAASG